jgi:CO/xanthine dehydrogenase FAD-binding subunit
MNLNTIVELKRPNTADQVIDWRDGYAWLAGGTWLFSEPQTSTDTLIDLEGLRWPSITASESGLEIAATCKIAELFAYEVPEQWPAASLFRDCCNALLASWKIWNAATVGGNICMSLPAGAMISLTTALEGEYTLWPRDGEPRTVPSLDFVTGNHANVLREGELLRSIHLPASALAKRTVFRQQSLVKLGRSAALLIGTCGQDGHDFRITVSAATKRPVQFAFDQVPSRDELRRKIAATLSFPDYFDDVNGSPEYKQHLTYHFAEQIRAELE